MAELIAYPKNIEGNGFFAATLRQFREEERALTERLGRTCDLVLTFNRGEDIDRALFDVMNVHSGTVERYFEAAAHWSETEKIKVILAVTKGRMDFNEHSRPGDFNLFVYRVNSLAELARHFMDNGHSAYRPDMDAVIRDIGKHYHIARVAGHSVAYRCG